MCFPFPIIFDKIGLGDYMKELLGKKNKKIAFGMFVILCLFHLPLIIKNILTADVLLNNYYYNGYSWEISLGRFGTFVVGLLKSYLSIPHIDYLFSNLFLTFSFILLLELFDVKDKLKTIACLLLFVVSPVVSATLLFHFWNVVYFLAFFLGVSSIYIYYKWDHKIGKYLIPIVFIVGALSFYQAYLSMIVTTFVLYNIHLILKQKFDYKESLKYIGCLLLGIITYFILMKLSQIVLHIDMASYSNANSILVSHNCAALDEINFAKSGLKDGNILEAQNGIMDAYRTIRGRMTSRFIKNGVQYNINGIRRDLYDKEII